MFIHNVFFWLRKDLSSTERQTFEAELRLLSQINYLERAYVGTPAQTEKRAVTDQSFDFATSFHFKSMSDHEFYQTKCEAHLKFVATCKTFWDRVIIYDIDPLI